MTDSSALLRVVVADDHPLFLEGVITSLRAAGIDVVASASDADGAVRLAAEHVPDVAHPIVRTHPETGRKCLGTVVGQRRDGIANAEVGTGIGILLILVLPDVAAYLLLPLIGVVLNGTSSALYATIGDLVEPEKLPRAFGLFYTLGSTCGLIAPLLLGALGDKIGVADAMIVTALLAFLTLPACMVLRPALQSLRD